MREKIDEFSAVNYILDDPCLGCISIKFKNLLENIPLIGESRVASVGVRRVKSALARSKSSDKFVIGFKQPLFVN